MKWDPESYDPLLKSLVDPGRVEASFGAMKRVMDRLWLRDPLTGCFNRQYLEGALGQVLGSPSPRRALWFMDVDHFKPINDGYGHQAGDEVLRGLVSGLTKRLRPGETLVRMGGDEFLVASPDAGGEGAEWRARDWVEAAPAWMSPAGGGLPKVTLSMGVWMPEGENPPGVDGLLERVDRALYASKRLGRNRYTRWTPALRRGPAGGGVEDARTLRAERDGARAWVTEVLCRVREARGEGGERRRERVARLAGVLLTRMKVPQERHAGILDGIRLHDIGGVAMSGRERAGGRHDPCSFPEAGGRLLEGIPFLREAAGVVRHQCEAWDGSGFPLGLKGEAIPIGARIFSVASAYDRLRTNGEGEGELSGDGVARALRGGAGRQFDPVAVEVLLRHPPEMESMGLWQGVSEE